MNLRARRSRGFAERVDMSNSHSTLVVGIGNPLRGDDGVGPSIANRIAALRLPGVEAITVHQLLPELAARLPQYSTVIFIDAIPCANPKTGAALRRISGEGGPKRFSHQLAPTQLLEMAKTISVRVPDAWLLTISVSSFDICDNLSSVAIANSQLGINKVLSIVVG